MTSPVEKLGTPILTMSGMKDPWGVAINQRGEVVVTEWRGHCVSVFSPSGEKHRSFGTCGSGQGQVMSPRGVTIDSDGNIHRRRKGGGSRGWSPPLIFGSPSSRKL